MPISEHATRVAKIAQATGSSHAIKFWYDDGRKPPLWLMAPGLKEAEFTRGMCLLFDRDGEVSSAIIELTKKELDKLPINELMDLYQKMWKARANALCILAVRVWKRLEMDKPDAATAETMAEWATRAAMDGVKDEEAEATIKRLALERMDKVQ